VSVSVSEIVFGPGWTRARFRGPRAGRLPEAFGAPNIVQPPPLHGRTLAAMTLRRALALVGAVLLLVVVYLVAWPTPLAPRRWRAPAAPGLRGPYASNGRLAGAVVLAPELAGPEALWPEPDGTLLTGTLDGRIVRVDPRTGACVTLARTGGRPIGLRRGPDGRLYVADARRGLLRLDRHNQVEVLVASFQGRPLLLADDVAPLPDGRVLFTDASTRFGLDGYQLDGLEHGSTGRVLAHDPRTGETALLLGGLDFPNGLAAAPDGASVLINETWAYRVRRLWVAGPRAGATEIVRDNLPGFPDNLTYDPARDVYWIALASPREPGLDALAAIPFARKAIARLPRALQPAPKRHGMVLAIRGDGTIVDFLDDPRADSYSPITHVVAVGPTLLYLGSFQHAGIARLELPGR
jgi:sugar lactone lactonase YvrE